MESKSLKAFRSEEDKMSLLTTAKAKEWSQMFDQTDFWFAFKLQGGLKTVSFSSMPCHDRICNYYFEGKHILSQYFRFIFQWLAGKITRCVSIHF